MKTLVSFAAGAALAVALSLALVSPSAADPAGDALAGGMLGFMAGAVAGSVAGGGVYYDAGPRYGGSYSWRRHVRACFRVYGDDYDPASNTYIDDYGDERRCRL